MIISNERSNCQQILELQTSVRVGSKAVEVEALELEVQLNSEFSFVDRFSTDTFPEKPAFRKSN